MRVSIETTFIARFIKFSCNDDSFTMPFQASRLAATITNNSVVFVVVFFLLFSLLGLLLTILLFCFIFCHCVYFCFCFFGFLFNTEWCYYELLNFV